MMKKLLYLGAVLASTTLSLNAQISIGGQPYSLSNNMSLTDVATYVSPALDETEVLRNIAEGDMKGEVPKFGKLVPANLNLNNSGTWTTLANGDRLWRLHVRAENAIGTTLYYSDFFMPQGATMFVYSPDRVEVYGGFNADNNDPSGVFVTSLVHTDECVVEYYEPAAVSGQGRIHISDVAHAYRWVKNSRAPYAQVRGFGDSGSCEVNINCSPEGNNWQDEKNGVARILLTAGGQQGWCTGTLVNNLRGDCTPYFLTAYHCADGASTSEFNQWIFYFKYEAPSCSDPTSQGTLASKSTTGATVKATSNDAGITKSDFCLLQLNAQVPATYTPYYAGWNANNTSSSSGVCISHPAGDIKKISTYTSATTSTSYSGVTANTHWEADWVATTNGNAVTEGGSSGGALFNSSGQIVGTLSGGPSSCGASSSSRLDYFGKFSYHWTSNGTASNRQLKPWLDPDNTGTLSLNGTYSPCSGGSTGGSNCVTLTNNTTQQIASSGTPTVTSSLAYTNPGTITDVNVTSLNITHTYTSDLTVTLSSPNGTSVTLLDNLCSSDNDINIGFDDQSATPYNSIPCPATTGSSYHPSGTLNSFNSGAPNGTWTLSVADGADGDGGTLNSWAIQICFTPPVGVSNTVPATVFALMPNPNAGSFTVALPEQTDGTLSIYNAQGQLLQTYNTANQTQLAVDLGAVAKGVYFARLSVNGQHTVQSVIVE